MQNHKGSSINIFWAALLLVAVSVVLPAQTPSNQQRSQPIGSRDLQQSINSIQQTQVGANQELIPIYGLQGVLIETVDGKTVSAQSVDQGFNPASSIKLATALVALRNFGVQHRFTTGFWTDGSFDKASGRVVGNLYVSGRDPSFHYEHAVMIAQQLNNLGIRTITGDMVVAAGFTMNFSPSARWSGQLLRDSLDAARRPAAATEAWTYERSTLGDQSSLQRVPGISVMGNVYVGAAAPSARLLLTHKSSKLTDVLKVLLCYSNNFMAERIGDSLGGPRSVRRQLVDFLGIPEDEIQLASLSGLGVNRVTPHAMMKIFRALRSELQKNNLSPSDIMPVAGIDPGTLEKRFTGPAWQGSVIAKTGTLSHTDGGASSLVGQMRTASGDLLFVIMNQQGNIERFRENQDRLVMQVQNSRGGPKPFNYTPVGLAMKLADTESISGSANNEFDPNLKTPFNSP